MAWGDHLDFMGHCPTCRTLMILTPDRKYWCEKCDGEPPWDTERPLNPIEKG